MVYFRQDDSPILDMTDAEWLAAGNRTVTTTVTVTGAAKPTVQVVAGSRCVAGKAVLYATLTNTGTAPADIRVTSSVGSSTVNGLASGTSKSVTFTTRSKTLSAGSVTATSKVTGSSTPETATAGYAARTCS